MNEADPKDVEARMRALVEQVPAIVYTHSARPAPAPFDYISPQAEAILGYPIEEWTRTDLDELWLRTMHPEDLPRVKALDEECLRTGQPFRCEYRLRARDGRWLWFRDESALVKDEDGRPLVWQGVMIDITASKQAEERLHEADSRFRMLVEHVPAATYMDVLDGNVTRAHTLYMSPQIRTITGFTPDEWMADDTLWERILHPNDRDRVIAEDRAGFARADPYVLDYRLIRADGEVVWIHEESELLVDERGKPLYWMGILFDVTSSVQAAEELKSARSRFQTLLEQIPAVVYLDEIGTGITNYISPQIEQVLGYTPAQWIARPSIWAEHVHPDDLDRVMDADDKSERNIEPFVERYRMVTRDHRVVWVEDRCVPVRDETGEPVYWHGVLYDITEQKRAEELEADLSIERQTSKRLRELDEMKNTFLSAVSHDLRTPLSAILGLGSTLVNPEVSLTDEERMSFSQRIVANAKKLNGLVTDLLDLDRLSRDAVELNLQLTDIADLVRAVATDEELIADGHPTEVDAETVTISVDGPKVERIVENMITNASRHTPRGTRIWVRVRPKDGGAMISVEDDGPGVPTEMREEVFEAFRQMPGGQSAHMPGVGIGLSLVRSLTELHGGRAWVEEREGGGASFRVFLPARA